MLLPAAWSFQQKYENWIIFDFISGKSTRLFVKNQPKLNLLSPQLHDYFLLHNIWDTFSSFQTLSQTIHWSLITKNNNFFTH